MSHLLFMCYHLITSGHGAWFSLHNSMVTTPKHVLVHKMFENSFKDFFLHHLPKDQGEASQLAVPQITFLPLLKSVVTLYFFQSPWPSKDDNQEWPCSDCQLSQHLWVHPIRSLGLVSFSLSLPLFDSSFTPRVSLHCSIFFHWLHAPRILEASLISEDWGNKGTEHPGLLHVICHLIPNAIQQQPHVFSTLPFATNIPIKALPATFHAL